MTQVAFILLGAAGILFVHRLCVGPSLADRVRIVRVLSRVGLADEARLFVLEGLAALK